MKIFNQFNESHDSPEAKALVDAFHENLYQLNHFLKLNQRRLFARTSPSIPLFAVIGPANAGKTLLLRNANIQYSQMIAQENPLCKTWITDNAIYLNIKGRTLSHLDFLSAWPVLYTLLEKSKREIPIDGILLVLSLADLVSMTPLQLKATINDYVATLTEFTDTAAYSVPVHLIITHLDILHGFDEYFADLSDHETEQSFGFTLLSDESKHEFQEKYQQLVNQLEQKLIKKLHQANTVEAKNAINNFPLQIDSLQHSFDELIQELFYPDAANCRYHLNSFFLCSNTSDNTTIDQLRAPLSKSFGLTLPAPVNALKRKQAYFTHQLLTSDLPNTVISDLESSRVPQALVAGVAVLALAFSIQWSASNFQQDIHIINVSAHAIRQYQAITAVATAKNPEQRLVNSIKALTILQKANNLIRKQNQHTLFISQTNRLQKRFNSIYKNALTQQLLPLIANDINLYLQHLKPSQADKKYAGLKAYLMLTYAQHRDLDYFMSWLETHWRSRHGMQLTAQQTRDLRQLLSESVPTINVDMDTVTDIRNTINALPKSFLAFLSLKDNPTANDKKKSLKVRLNGRLVKIPPMYQKSYFNDIYTHTIKQIGNTVSSGNWVLGKSHSVKTEAEHDEQLIHTLQQLYCDDYKQWWLAFLDNIGIQPHQGLSETANVLKSLSSQNSSLQQALELIQQNTAPFKQSEFATDVFNEEIADSFIDINRFTLDKSQALRDVLVNLKNDVQQVISAFDSNQAAFNYAQYEFNHDVSHMTQALTFAEESPPVIQNWLKQLVDNTWAIVMLKATKHIEHQWATQVYPEYVRAIAGRYPFADQNEVKLNDFNHFFAANGTINRFFANYIKPFIESKSANWHLKTKHNQQLPLTEQALQQFIRSHLIHKMYFTSKPNQLNFTFELIPQQLDDNLKEIIFDLDGQQYYNYSGSKRSKTFTWPQENHQHKVRIDLADKKGKHTIISKTGDWALFKLFEQYPLTQPNLDLPEYIFIVDGDGQRSQYQLKTDNMINPLVPSITKLFELPAQLFTESVSTHQIF